MGLLDKIRAKLYKILKINTLGRGGFTINRLLTHDENCAKNRTWYNGDSYELSQLFGQIPNGNQSFWGAVETQGLEIRKIHTGLPKLIVNTLTNVSLSDMNDLRFKDKKAQLLWDEIAKENNFKKLIKQSTSEVLKVGDGAFKISFSQEASNLPIIEFVSGEDVEYTFLKGRIKEIYFYSHYEIKGAKYTLQEIYGYGFVEYHLFKEDQEVSLDTITATQGLENVYFDKSVILAEPYMIYDSDMYKGRGASIFDGKTDAFDALDEIVSQWQDAVRAGRVKTYIPEALIPRDFEAGFILKPNPFDNRFIKIGNDMSESGKNEIKVEQPIIQVDAYLQTYITYLDLALQGLISPSTLGIDVKKLDNAESQREKEKVTLYTRQIILETLEKVLKKLVQVVFNAYNIQYGQPLEKVEAETSFGEYANPSFEAVIETMSNPNTPMSIEAKVDEIWGDSKTEEWKQEEVQRIKNEQGIIQVEEPSFAKDYSEDIYDEEEE